MMFEIIKLGCFCFRLFNVFFVLLKECILYLFVKSFEMNYNMELLLLIIMMVCLFVLNFMVVFFKIIGFFVVVCNSLVL